MVGPNSALERDNTLMLDVVEHPVKDNVQSLGMPLVPSLLLDRQTGGSCVQECIPPVFLVTLFGKVGLYHRDICASNYNNVLYVGPPLKMTWKLELVQNTQVWVLMGANRLDHMTKDFLNADIQ